MLNEYSVVLNIDVEKYQKGNLLNEFVEPGKKIKSISIDRIRKFEDDEIVDVKQEELDEICYKEKKIILMEHSSPFNNRVTMTFENENGFTVKEMFNNIVEFEKKTRPLTDWFGGVDAHHVYFEGLHFAGEMNTYAPMWGS